MTKPVLVHIFYSYPYQDTKHPEYYEFELETKLLVENVPHVGDSFNMIGLFSENEIEKESKSYNPDLNHYVIDLVLVKSRILHYKNFKIDSIGLCVTDMDFR